MAVKQGGPKGFEMSDAPERPPAGGDFTFAGFVLSLSTSALMHLGVAPRGEEQGQGQDEPSEVNLPAARQVIDILEMMKTKTQGNLEQDERDLLDRVIHDLQLRFVEARDGG